MKDKNIIQNKPKFNSSYSRNNLLKINDTEYIINQCEAIGIHWILLYMNAENVTYFDRFRISIIKNIIRNIYRIQAYHSIICRYFCIGFIDFSLKEYSDLFFPSEYENRF